MREDNVGNSIELFNIYLICCYRSVLATPLEPGVGRTLTQSTKPPRGLAHGCPTLGGDRERGITYTTLVTRREDPATSYPSELREAHGKDFPCWAFPPGVRRLLTTYDAQRSPVRGLRGRQAGASRPISRRDRTWRLPCKGESRAGPPVQLTRCGRTPIPRTRREVEHPRRLK